MYMEFAMMFPGLRKWHCDINHKALVEQSLNFVKGTGE